MCNSCTLRLLSLRCVAPAPIYATVARPSHPLRHAFASHGSIPLPSSAAPTTCFHLSSTPFLVSSPTSILHCRVPSLPTFEGCLVCERPTLPFPHPVGSFPNPLPLGRRNIHHIHRVGAWPRIRHEARRSWDRKRGAGRWTPPWR